MEIEEKLKILKRLDTKSLIGKIYQYENELQNALLAEADFKNSNHGFLGSGDCQEVKRIVAELAVQAPETNETGKKLTIADKEAWLMRQRKENKELSDAAQKQREVSFLVDNHAIKVEIARRRLAGATTVLALRTQQIAFLASG